ncbi:hypothetical protein [Synechocystis sp. LKSZ1]|uniref:hypothetical protein n=1 Tax=Synechocystis sp. LKSZ1 TaxID=3144951 RepID=UPI00336BDC1F
MASLGIFLVGFLLIGLSLAQPALATTLTFQWTGQQGYHLEGSLHYPDDLTAGRITEQGQGQTQAIDQLVVAIYSPQGQLLEQYTNIVAGQSHNPYLQLTVNPQTVRLQGEVDVGGTQPQEWFLKGKLGQTLHLIKIDQNGQEIPVDQGRGKIAVGT